jgi:hypothetical protein
MEGVFLSFGSEEPRRSLMAVYPEKASRDTLPSPSLRFAKPALAAAIGGEFAIRRRHATKEAPDVPVIPGNVEGTVGDILVRCSERSRTP